MIYENIFIPIFFPKIISLGIIYINFILDINVMPILCSLIIISIYDVINTKDDSVDLTFRYNFDFMIIKST